jgi:hypothetical protein
MKTTLSVLIIIILMSTTSPAQEKNFGIRGGLTLYTITATNEFEGADIKSLSGFTLGISYQFAITEQFYIQPEFNFVKKGALLDLDISQGGTTVQGEIKLALDYLEIPVLAKAYFGTDTKFFLMAGPSIGYGVGGKGKYKLTITDPNLGTVSDSGSIPVKFGESSEGDLAFENRIDLGLNFGAGVLIANKVFIDARYNLGLSNLSGDNDDPSKNRGFQFTVGVPLAINQKSK